MRFILSLCLLACAPKTLIDTRPVDLSEVDGHPPGANPAPGRTHASERAVFASFPPEHRASAVTLFERSYCYCGCTESVVACVEDPRCACRNCARRMLTYAAAASRDGASLERIEASLDAASASFHEAPFDFSRGPEAAQTGPPDATVTLTEFADFGCPHCARVFPLIEQVVEESEDVRVEFRPYPLNQHPRTLESMEAAEFARVSGRFWPFATALFESGGRLQRDALLRLASRHGLDPVALEAALDAQLHRQTILDHHRLGRRAEVRSTPSIFVNGRPLGLNPNRDNLAYRIDMERNRERCD